MRLDCDVDLVQLEDRKDLRKREVKTMRVHVVYLVYGVGLYVCVCGRRAKCAKREVRGVYREIIRGRVVGGAERESVSTIRRIWAVE